MRTFFSSPFSSKAESQEFQDLCNMLRTVLKSLHPVDVPLKLWTLLEDVFNYDLVLWSAGGKDFVGHGCQVYPPIGGKNYLPLVLTPEQGAVILKQSTKCMVRIIEQKDSQFISLMLKESQASWAKDSFTVLYLRQAISENNVGMVGFVSTKKNAFSDTHVACLFKLGSVLTEFWKKHNRENPGAKILPDSEFLPISELPGMENVVNSERKL